MDHFYALIMAGGGGTRLWPLSRRDRPKQMLPLTEERTMIQITVERLYDLLTPEQIFIVAGPDLAQALHENVPRLPVANFIIEPEPRNSGPAAGLGTYTIAQRDPDAVVAVLSADHHIANEERFLESLSCAEHFAREGQHIVTLGITPSFAATGFGYIKREAAIGEFDGLTIYRAGGFREKPDPATAQAFVQSGLYSWNGGMFIWHVQTAIAEFERQQPTMARGLHNLTAGNADGSVEQTWGSFPKQSIDYLIMENAANVAVIPVDMGWSDVGTWGALFEVLAKNDDGNAVRSANSGHIQIDTHHTLLVSDRMVVTIGVDDLVIVDTDDVLLVCHRDRAQDVRAIVEQLRAAGKIDYC
ncbi:MAG: mannose-1-phosphate guanylyltransferase [Aggregatilineales bacterium]